MTVKVEAPIGLFEENLQDKDWFFSVYRKLTQDLKTKTFGNFSPTLSGSGSMSISSSSITLARYAAIGELVFVEFAASFTVGGTPDLSVQFELPLDATGPIMLPAVVKDGGNELSGFALATASSKIISVRRYDGTNWNAGSGREIKLSGYYRSTEIY